MKDYYSILGISRSASEEEIKDAYRRLAKRWHPDSNPDDEFAARMMQDLNRAKEVLFDSETRSEYLNLLSLQDTLSADNIERLRQRWGEQGFAEPHKEDDIRPTEIAAKPFSKKRFIGVLVLLAAVIAGIVIFFNGKRHRTMADDPINEIIERNRSAYRSPFREPRIDSIVVPDAPADRLAQQAALLAMMQEYSSAAKYWEKALTLDPYNAEVVTNLIFHYLKMKNYERAFSLVESNVSTDEYRIVIFDRIGEFFLLEGKRLDAFSSFEKVLMLARTTNISDSNVAAAVLNARERIARR